MTDAEKRLEELREEIDDVAKQANDDMPEYISRMVVEYTDLTYRIHKLEEFIKEHEPDEVNSDGIIVAMDEYNWLLIQHMNMCAYAHAIWVRAKMHGYNLNVVNESK